MTHVLIFKNFLLKVMRSLKRVDSPIISGMQIHHNFIRSHMTLDGKTPSDMAGIEIEGDNKWITLIQNASTINTNNPS